MTMQLAVFRTAGLVSIAVVVVAIVGGYAAYSDRY